MKSGAAITMLCWFHGVFTQGFERRICLAIKAPPEGLETFISLRMPKNSESALSKAMFVT